jgi:hypothetical protein
MAILFIPFQGKLHQIELNFDLGELPSIKHYTISSILLSYLAAIAQADEENLSRPQVAFDMPFQEFVDRITVTAVMFCGDKLDERIAEAKRRVMSAVERHMLFIELGYLGGIDSYFAPVKPKN